MGYVTASIAASGAPIYAELRGERVAMQQSKLPFVTSNYKR
jgi:aminomethyltransferase